MILSEQLNFSEVFRTDAGTVYQSDKERCWYVDFAGKRTRVDFCGLLSLKRTVYSVDIDKLLLKCDRSSDLEILSVCALDQLYVLNTLEIIALRELLEGTFVMFQLNHIIYDCLNRLAV